MKNLKVLALSTIILGSLGVATSGHAKAADISNNSTGTLEIKDGTFTFNGVTDLDFGDHAFDANKDVQNNLTADDAVASATDTTIADAGWTVAGTIVAADKDKATLIINDITLSDTATTVFTEGAGGSFGDQSVAINKDKTSMTLTPAQQKAAYATTDHKAVINIDWTATQGSTTTPKSFN